MEIKTKAYGYIRVSTKEQNEVRQVIALREVGVSEKNIYMDKQSGKDFNRPQYKKLLRKDVYKRQAGGLSQYAAALRLPDHPPAH